MTIATGPSRPARVPDGRADGTTFAYIEGRPGAPKGADWESALDAWRSLRTDSDAVFDKEAVVDVASLVPQVTWGRESPQGGAGRRPRSLPAAYAGPAERETVERALHYMGLEPGTPLSEIPVDRVSIGSCTNSRIEDLRAAAAVVEGRRVAGSVRAMVVPARRRSSARPRTRASTVSSRRPASSGARRVARCVGMNPDILAAGERCASTSNRNFEGRQAAGGRTHLLSPARPREPPSPATSPSERPRVTAPVQFRGVQGTSPGVDLWDMARGLPGHGWKGHVLKELRHSGRAAVLDRADVDTDQIIPKQFLSGSSGRGTGSSCSSTG